MRVRVTATMASKLRQMHRQTSEKLQRQGQIRLEYHRRKICIRPATLLRRLGLRSRRQQRVRNDDAARLGQLLSGSLES